MKGQEEVKVDEGVEGVRGAQGSEQEVGVLQQLPLREGEHENNRIFFPRFFPNLCVR